MHETPQALDSPFTLHQVSGPFRRAAGGELVHEFSQSLDSPLPLHQISSPFQHPGGGGLVHEFPQALVSPFPLHQVSDSFRPAAGQVGAWLPAKPYSTVGSRQHRRRFPAWRHHCWHRPAGALFAVMLFINLQKRYNEMARLASGRFGQRKGTRSKQLITGGIIIGERTCLTKSLV